MSCALVYGVWPLAVEVVVVMTGGSSLPSWLVPLDVGAAFFVNNGGHRCWCAVMWRAVEWGGSAGGACAVGHCNHMNASLRLIGRRSGKTWDRDFAGGCSGCMVLMKVGMMSDGDVSMSHVPDALLLSRDRLIV